MNKFGHISRLFTLLAALCFGLSIAATTIYASEKPAADAHSTTVEQAADAAHGEADAHAAEADHGGSHGEGSLSAAKLKDLFWRVLNFIALMIILVKFGAKPIASALGGRQAKVKNELEDLETRRDEAEKQYRDFESKLATVEKDIDSIVEKAVAQAEVEDREPITEQARRYRALIGAGADRRRGLPPGAVPVLRRRRGHGGRRRLCAGARVRHAADRRHRYWYRQARHAVDRLAVDSRRVAVPAHAAGSFRLIATL